MNTGKLNARGTDLSSQDGAHKQAGPDVLPVEHVQKDWCVSNLFKTRYLRWLFVEHVHKPQIPSSLPATCFADSHWPSAQDNGAAVEVGLRLFCFCPSLFSFHLHSHLLPCKCLVVKRILWPQATKKGTTTATFIAIQSVPIMDDSL